MTDPVDPVPPIGPRATGADDRRQDDRRARDRRQSGRMMVPIEGAGPEPDRPRAEAPGTTDPAGSTGFAAQVMGQGGEKRGLKGGASVLSSARKSYLGAEYSGDKDRRPPSGKVSDKDV
ncbi:MAG: hypothetical protein HZY74_02825 [Brevundimonas sp.]|nr:MAG: hypothetical protein HZY74_02825 [Brevundimonas sp.]